MVMVGLKEELAGSSFDERQQLLISLFPGILFGFPPPNIKEMLERIDCSTCREMVEYLTQVLVSEKELFDQIEEFCRPVRDGNASRQATFKARRSWPVIGGLFKKPVAHPDPDYTSEVWYIEKRSLIDAKMARLEELRAKDVPHWGTPKDTEISKVLVGCFLAKDGHQVTSL